MNPSQVLSRAVNTAIANGEKPIVEIPVEYVKIRFSSIRGEHTAGIVVPFHEMKRKSISDISRYFPYSESRKMHTLDVSPIYKSWDEAFAHQF